MPSVATGAVVANRKLLCIGISGDGDTANIGMGQFKHVCRRNVPLVYIIENNGCYGLTKGQFSATADLNQPTSAARPARRTTIPPFDLCVEAIVGGRHVRGPLVRRRQEADGPAAEGGPQAQGDCRCSTSSARASRSTTSTARPRAGTGPRSTRSRSTRSASSRACPRSRSSRRPASRPASSSTTARGSPSSALRHEEHEVTDRVSALRLLIESQRTQRVPHRLVYVDPKRPDFVTMQEMTDTPLALLPDEALRPSRETLAKIMETI